MQRFFILCPIVSIPVWLLSPLQSPARFRGKGYGNEILRLLLNEAHEIGIEKALVTIRLDNTASQAVALANGGVITERTDERVLIWINSKNR